jgi:cytidine deaminase
MGKLSKEVANMSVALARSSAAKAYSPYSNFRVGASVVCKDGTIFSGCNVENASYGLTICAERNAIAKAVSEGHREIIAVFVYTPTQKATSPCGACRQVINEFGPEATVHSVCDTADTIEATMDTLLPFAFGPKNLQR